MFEENIAPKSSWHQSKSVHKYPSRPLLKLHLIASPLPGSSNPTYRLQMISPYQIQFVGANGKFKLLRGGYALTLAPPDDFNASTVKTETATETNIDKAGDSVTITEKKTTVTTKAIKVPQNPQGGVAARHAPSTHRAVVTADPRTVSKNVSRQF